MRFLYLSLILYLGFLGCFTPSIVRPTSSSGSTTSLVLNPFSFQFTTAQSSLINSATGDDAGYDVATDSNGNTFVFGTTCGNLVVTNAGLCDAFLSKFNSSGSMVWIKQLTSAFSATITDASKNDVYFGNLSNSALAVDSQGYVYFAASTSGDMGGPNTQQPISDIYLGKVDTNGNPIWIKQIIDSTAEMIAAGVVDSHHFELAGGIGIDGSGNVYVTGSTQANLAGVNSNNGVSSDVVIAKFNSSGTPIWVKQFTTGYNALIFDASGDEQVYASVTDSLGNTIISGSTASHFVGAGSNPGGYDIFVAKVDTSGTLQWLKELTPAYSGFITSAIGNDYGKSIATDTHGNIYIGGQTGSNMQGAGVNGVDMVTIKLTSAGVVQWVRQLNGGNNDGTAAVATDTNDNVYFVGFTNGNLAGVNAGGIDGVVGKYDTNGNLLWSKQLVPSLSTRILSATADEYLYGISIDALGNPTITGSTASGFFATFGGGTNDAVVFRMDRNGYF